MLMKLCIETSGSNNSLKPHFSEDDLKTIDYFKNIYEDRLKLYHYCECQLSRVAFANSIFIAALALLINKEMIENKYWASALFFPFLLSLAITLLFTIPKFFMPWKKYEGVDHRSIYGVENLKKMKKDYKEYISELTPKKNL